MAHVDTNVDVPKAPPLELDEAELTALRKAYEAGDVNKAGQTTEQFIEKVLRELKIPSVPSQVQHFIQIADVNHDGKIDFHELVEFAKHRKGELWKTFEEIDRNRDGVITLPELELALEKLQFKFSCKQAEDLLAFLDKNNDGKVDFDEWKIGLALLPTVNIQAAFEYWQKQSEIDLGDNIVVPTPIHTPYNAHKLLLAGGIAGVFSRTATAPLDRLRIMMQVEVGESIGIAKSVQHIYGEKGLTSFWRGNGTNCIKIFPESAIKFYTFEQLKGILCSEPDSPRIHERFSAGAIAGVVSQGAVYPLDCVRTRLATTIPGVYNGTLDCLRKMIRTEGFMSLYQGLVPSLIGIIPYAGIDLAVFSTLKDIYTKWHPDQEPDTLTLLGCGAFSGTVAQFVAYPCVLVRTRLQAQRNAVGEKALFKGPWDCFIKTIKLEGFTALYRGMVPNVLKVLPAVSISYAMYEHMKRFFQIQ
eukprot:GILK01002582.1.p1 GENE.GILK01002582.1~~GILK01002582.1.p1  ORF type:complete len:484 (+),score=64.71 GILK01002582.1:39-1454(+)